MKPLDSNAGDRHVRNLYKFLVQETCIKNLMQVAASRCVRHASFFYKLTGTSFLYLCHRHNDCRSEIAIAVNVS